MSVLIHRILRKKREPGSIGTADFRRDFEVELERRADADELGRNPRLSLYCLEPEKRWAVFVETPDGVDLTVQAFLYQAQYEHAQRLFCVPYNAFHRLARELPPACERSLLVHSVGRCGSTLLTRILRDVPGVRCFSEPDVYTQVLELRERGRLDAGEARDLLRSATALLSTRPVDRNAELAVIKFRSEVIRLHREITAARGGDRALFMYRCAEDVIQSYDRIWGYPQGRRRWLLRTPVVAALYRRRLRRACLRSADFFARYDGLLRERSAADVIPELGYTYARVLLDWLAKVKAYLEAHREDPSIAALRYEDLVRDPAGVLRLLFAHCGLPAEAVTGAMRALAVDSQRGTSIARRSSPRYGMDERDRAAIRRLFAEHTDHGAPDAVLPGTLSPEPEDAPR